MAWFVPMERGCPSRSTPRAAEQRWNVTRSVRLHLYLLRVRTPALRQKPENRGGKSGRLCRDLMTFYPRIPQWKLRAIFGRRFAAVKKSAKVSSTKWKLVFAV